MTRQKLRDAPAPKLHGMGGSPYRYFSDDPEKKGRGPGYYRWYYGQYFKKGENEPAS